VTLTQDLDHARAQVLATIDDAAAPLRALSLDIHSHPELAYEELHAHAALTSFLEARGFSVTRGAFGVPTAFRAVAGNGAPTLAVLCEYDALPGIGHACGHNLIAAAGVATGLALQAVLGEGNGTIVVLGTPAEERGGGKVDLIDAGAFDGVDAAMMLHPSGGKLIRSGQVRVPANPNALQSLRVEYFGRNAHAASAPWDGVNALDALIQAFNNVAMLRQQMRPTARVHGVITEGGRAPNIIPDHTAAHFYVREENRSRLEELKPRVIACFEGAALATGCRFESHWDGHPYSDMQNSSPLVDAYARHAVEVGLEPIEITQVGGGSTDMGNVSYAVPSIHPSFGLTSPDAGNHTPGFTAAAGSEEGHADMLRAAKALALTALDAYADEAVLVEAKREFAARQATHSA